MKKAIVLFFFLPHFLFAQDDPRSFFIEGKMKDIPHTVDYVFLQYRGNGKWFTDSIRTNDGKYMFRGTIGSSSLAKMGVKFKPGADGQPVPMVPDRHMVAFFLKPGKTKIVSADSFSNIELSGAITQAANHRTGKKINEKNKGEIAAVGSLAPAFNLPDTAGKMVSLSSFMGQYVLVEFWASWCAPCKPENAQLVKLYNKYKDRNFHIIGISLDGNEYDQQWRKTIRKDKLTWTQLSNQQFARNEVTNDYDISFLPQNFLVDPSGKIIAKNLKDNALEMKLAEVLK